MSAVGLPFVNRKQEVKVLSNLLLSPENREQILIVSAKTGVGKTTLVDKVLEKYKEAPIFHVRTIDHPEFVPDQGEYLRRAYSAIADTAARDKRIPDLASFQRMRRGSSAARTILKGTLVHAGKKYLGEEATSVLAEAAGEAPTIFDSSAQGELEAYAFGVLERHRCVLRIENIHKIDEHSLESLCRILSACKDVFAIWEYTEGAKSAIPLSAIKSACQNFGVTAVAFGISAIPPEEIFAELKNSPELLFELLKRHYEAENGNLRVLVDLQIWVDRFDGAQSANTPPDSSGSGNTTMAVLRALEQSRRFTLTLVVAHGGVVEVEILKSVFQSLSPEKVEALGLDDPGGIIADLLSINYLRQEGSSLWISHDSITSTIVNDEGSRKYFALCYGFLIEFYRKVLEKPDDFVPRAEALYWLAQLYSRTNQLDKLMWVLEQCGRSALASLAPRRLVTLFEQIAEGSAKSELFAPRENLDQLLALQAEILYDANWLDEACEIFEKISNLTPTSKLMYADACVGTDRSDTGKAALLDLENIEPPQPESKAALKLSIGLIRLHSLRVDGELEECEELFRKLLAADGGLSQRERAFLYRSADVGLYKDNDVPEIINHLKKSIELCELEGLRSDEAAARLALAQHLGYSGQLDEAEEQLNILEDLSKEVWIERYSIINNRAIIELLRGSDQAAIVNDLKTALMLATEDGDRLLILANLLGAGQTSAAAKLLRLLEEIPDLADELAKIGHHNLAVYYADEHDIDASEHHRKIAVAMKNEPDAGFWNAALGNLAPSTEGVSLRISKRYYLTFIVHWRLTSSTFKTVEQ